MIQYVGSPQDSLRTPEELQKEKRNEEARKIIFRIFLLAEQKMSSERGKLCDQIMDLVERQAAIIVSFKKFYQKQQDYAACQKNKAPLSRKHIRKLYDEGEKAIEAVKQHAELEEQIKEKGKELCKKIHEGIEKIQNGIQLVESRGFLQDENLRRLKEKEEAREALCSSLEEINNNGFFYEKMSQFLQKSLQELNDLYLSPRRNDPLCRTFNRNNENL